MNIEFYCCPICGWLYVKGNYTPINCGHLMFGYDGSTKSNTVSVLPKYRDWKRDIKNDS